MADKKNSNFTFILVSIVIALIGALIAHNAIQSNMDLVDVVFVEENLEARTVIEKNMIGIRQIPKSAVHKNAISNLNNDMNRNDLENKVIGKVAITDLFYGQQIIKDVLSNEESEKLVSQIELGTNNRLIAIPGSSLNTLGGRITKNDYIDIIVSFQSLTLSDGNGVNFTKTMFHNIPIVDIVGESDNITAIIIEVSPYEAEMLSYVINNNGKISTTLVPYDGRESSLNAISPEIFLRNNRISIGN